MGRVRFRSYLAMVSVWCMCVCCACCSYSISVFSVATDFYGYVGSYNLHIYKFPVI